jgi:ribosomal protein S18 acetylase RimI-like enzyme
VLAALSAFRDAGLGAASLSVTVDNRRAYRIYEGLGFEVQREFGAHAWVRPPARLAWPA